jgi:hypothetical protein
MTPRVQHAERQHHQGEDRQEVNRAPRSEEAQLMNPERADADHEHQQHPQPAERAMRGCALRPAELHYAKRECRHRRKRMQLDSRTG